MLLVDWFKQTLLVNTLISSYIPRTMGTVSQQLRVRLPIERVLSVLLNYRSYVIQLTIRICIATRPILVEQSKRLN